MKPSLKKEKNTIFINEINTSHIIVAIDDDNSPVIMTNSDCGDNKYKFMCLSDQFTLGNCYREFYNIQQCIINYIIRGWKIEVFHQNDWRKALQWLIDNA